MKLSSFPFVAVFLLFVGIAQVSRAQVTPDSIANHIALDTGRPSDPYMPYCIKLATLLSTYSPEALERILGKRSPSIPGVETLNETLDLAPINFGNRSSKLTSSAMKELDKVISYLHDNPEAEILIGGHTVDNLQKLSGSRATAAKLYLAQNGIDPSRIEAKGYGNSQHLDGATTSEQRRIEITIKP